MGNNISCRDSDGLYHVEDAGITLGNIEITAVLCRHFHTRVAHRRPSFAAHIRQSEFRHGFLALLGHGSFPADDYRHALQEQGSENGESGRIRYCFRQARPQRRMDNACTRQDYRVHQPWPAASDAIILVSEAKGCAVLKVPFMNSYTPLPIKSKLSSKASEAGVTV